MDLFRVVLLGVFQRRKEKFNGSQQIGAILGDGLIRNR